MSNTPTTGTGDVQLTKSQMTVNDWVNLITRIATLLVGLGGISALWGIQDKQPTPDKPMPVIVDPATPVAPVKPIEPAKPAEPALTKDDLAKMISDSETRILKAFDEKLKAFEEAP